ncbi:Hypothetical protein GbCGDNIH9_8670 [Granulibacter bethesdensis]|uniref:Uncharacterized protein n=1 Tax=Granulibacter bethesdensis TaxID=364410 RepID=A0AAC9P9E4_9PROT|nr:Hypothetical protein GbCGDNIH9_8670 [Granulibacter bethesdensis]APH62792.1 Hypothetical protein GbCGDNIH8_8670 [Granulibacter bethesdensis]
MRGISGNWQSISILSVLCGCVDYTYGWDVPVVAVCVLYAGIVMCGMTSHSVPMVCKGCFGGAYGVHGPVIRCMPGHEKPSFRHDIC